MGNSRRKRMLPDPVASDRQSLPCTRHSHAPTLLSYQTGYRSSEDPLTTPLRYCDHTVRFDLPLL